MNRSTSLLSRLDLRCPIIQAPMAGGITSPELVASVCNAGGLGSLGAAYMSPEQITKAIRAIRQKTLKPFLINLFVPEHCLASPEQQKRMCNLLREVCTNIPAEVDPVESPYCPSFYDQVSILLNEKAPIVSFTFGIPDQDVLDALKKNGTFIIGTATSLSEALQLKEKGFDAIVAQGIEAGGHRGTFCSSGEDQELDLETLVKQLKEINLPIVAAGGIATPSRVKDMIELGAQAVQIGTAFITTKESGADEIYKETLLQQTHDSTELTKAFSGRVARGVSNQFIRSMKKYNEEILMFPIQNKLTRTIRNSAVQSRNPDFMSLWAGQSVSLCERLSAHELTRKLASLITSEELEDAH